MRIFGIIAVCAVVLTGIGMYTHQNRVEAPYVKEGHVMYAPAEKYLSERIRLVGPNRAGREMKATGEKLDLTESHTLAHIFGQTLFEEVGLDGFTSCDTSFLYGCIHQFVGMAIAEFGSNVALQLFDSCTKKWEESSLTCHHAMGHGFVGYFGYSPEDLDASMHACDLIEPEERLYFYRCLNGAFMEYNFHELETSQESFSSPRSLDENNPYEPCDVLDGRYKSACFRQLPLWWYFMSVSERSSEESFIASGMNCARARTFGAEEADSCFRGLGFVAGRIVGADTTQAQHLCTIAAKSPGDRTLCFSDAIYQLRIEGITNYLALCEAFGLDGSALKYCQERASYPI